MIASLICSFFGTICFSVLFNVPKKFYIGCGITGSMGWLCYYLLLAVTSSTVATFAGTLLVVLMARILAVWLKCPITIFLVPGIFPLLPGTSVYYTAYHLVTENLSEAAHNGLEALKLAFAIVIAIVFVFSVPRELFQFSYWRKRRLKKQRIED